MTVVIIFTALPISIFLLHKQEQTILKQIISEGFNSAEILSRSAANILLMNGGNISTAQIDCREMMDILKPFTEKGMVYAEAIIMSSNKNINGRILASINLAKAELPIEVRGNHVSESSSNTIPTKPFHREIKIPGKSDTLFEMADSTVLPGGNTIIVGRVMYSETAILSPVIGYRNIMFMTFLVVVGGMIIVGYALSALLSRPIIHLTQGVEKIEAGDLDHEVPVTSKDELGRLGISFNRMAKILAMKISELEEMNRTLTRLDSLKDEFLANTSHEIRTPINGIVGIAESLLSGAAGKLEEPVRQNLSLIVSSGRRLAGLVNNILDFSRIKNMDITLDRKPVDLHSIINIAVTIAASAVQKKSISLSSDILPASYHINGDENRLQQIFLNLIDNAIKFTEKGNITISASKSKDSVIIKISDTGIGIAPEKHKEIFEPFVQADGSIARRFGGTGLGLAITKNLVELHGGSIEVQSAPGQGSTFIVVLPLFTGNNIEPGRCIEETAKRLIANQASEENYTAAGHKTDSAEGIILVVDDDLINLQVLINHLTLSNYEVCVARSGQEAIDLLFSASFKADLVLLDIMMPVMTGFEVCKILREKYSFSDLPVIMLTARSSPDDIIAGFEVGANDYITKPFDRRELIARVKNFVELKKSTEKQKQLIQIQKDLALAKEIQTQILPRQIPSSDRMSIAVKYLPMEAIGGDYYDFFAIDNDHVGIMIADVAGHGISAALLGSMMKIAFSIHHDFASKPDKLLEALNQEMAYYTEFFFITAQYLYIDTSQNTCIFSNAGHWPAILYKRTDNEIIPLYTRGRPIGTSASLEFSLAALPILQGDRILIYTDGILECRNRSGEIFGSENLYQLFRETKGCTPEEALEAIITKAAQWTGKVSGVHFDDDVCLICIDIL